MRILNVEDEPIKHFSIRSAIQNGGFRDADIEQVEYLDEALNKIREQNECNTPYDLIITDMWYPATRGGGDANSGDKLINTLQKEGCSIPIILCSSMDYVYPDILGCVHYSDVDMWEDTLIKLIKKI